MRDDLAGEFREAFSSGGDLLLHYLPAISMATGHVMGMDALARWSHPTRGFIPPAEFVPLAERLGLLGPLTEWVLKTALRQLSVWLGDGYDLIVSVNLSPANLEDERLPRIVRGQVRALGVPAERIALEIPEATVLAAGPGLVAIAASLREIGVFLTVDSVTLDSSPAAADRIGARAVKFDRSVINNADDRTVRERMAATIANAKRRGLLVVAEGIEDRATYDVLGDLGCDVAIGYLMSSPLPPLDIADWLQNSPWGLPR